MGCGVLMGGWVGGGWVSGGSGWMCGMRLGCVFCCCFCFSMAVVLVFYCGGFGVGWWWVGCGWGIHGCWQRGWAVSCGGGGWFFYFVFLYIVDFFNVILILKYIILMYRIEE